MDPAIRGLILTSYDDDEALFAAIMAGAAGYVLKQIRGTDLVDAVRRVAAGQSLLDPAVTARVLERIRNGRRAARRARDADRAGAPDPRADRRGADEPRRSAERMFLAEKTVKNYVSSLLAKLGLERRTQAAVLATRLLGAQHPWHLTRALSANGAVQHRRVPRGSGGCTSKSPTAGPGARGAG